MNKPLLAQCPIPLDRYPVVTMAHGGGGRLMHDLISKMFYAAFDNEFLKERHDGASLPPFHGRTAFTTDSYVISPLFFPGGDIGKLSLYGTVNDLAMCGARPKYLSLAFILEEGLPMDTLWRVINSLSEASANCRVEIVTGDTKVVERGSGDGIFINISGIGHIDEGVDIAPRRVLPGDVVILSGDIGRHGISVLAAREELGFSTAIESDLAPLHDSVAALISQGIDIHCLRDLTRGGLGTALNEIASVGKIDISINEKEIPVMPQVRGACEMLGLDPLYVANEGRFIAILPESSAQIAIKILADFEVSKSSRVIGHVIAGDGQVSMKSIIGTSRIVDMLSGEQLPRIC